MKADLHLHSTASDGRLDPAGLVHYAAGRGVEVMALTDHDTLEGLAPAAEAARGYPALTFIPGVEISTEGAEREVHVLGYFMDAARPELEEALRRSRESRFTRACLILDRLAELGLPLDWERVQQIAGEGSIGRPHIAQAMLERDYVASLSEAFGKYIGRGGDAYVERDKMSPGEAVRLVAGSGGLPFLAHPINIAGLETLVAELQKVGLAGIEAYYGSYSADAVSYLASLASRYGLIASGGSDWHGLDGGEEVQPGEVKVPPECIGKLLALGRTGPSSPAR